MTGARDAQDPGTGAAGQLRGESSRTACGATDRHHVPARMATARTAENDVTPIAHSAPARIQSRAGGLAIR